MHEHKWSLPLVEPTRQIYKPSGESSHAAAADPVLRDLQATLIGGGCELDRRRVFTILLAVVRGSESGDVRWS
ncbi:unnamed protein product [Prunus armeniaca]|uniref:Uncharacterized protein n=1 Tax=Prunus armeniaca TaxID=36596 RepID=A0A6J5VEY0_PRUAR|nr:unnamed protein product [Prunus armeniaca]